MRCFIVFLEIGSNYEELYEGQANLKFIETHLPLPPSDKIWSAAPHTKAPGSSGKQNRWY